MILRWICQGKMKWFIGTRGYFGAKSKDYDTTMKRAVRGHPPGINPFGFCEVYEGWKFFILNNNWKKCYPS
jgi:hypothetical protein